MQKAIGFVRRSTDLQGMSLQDQKVLLSKWMKSAPIVQERGIDPEIARFVEYTGTGARMGETFNAILEDIRTGRNDYQNPLQNFKVWGVVIAKLRQKRSYP